MSLATDVERFRTKIQIARSLREDELVRQKSPVVSYPEEGYFTVPQSQRFVLVNNFLDQALGRFANDLKLKVGLKKEFPLRWRNFSERNMRFIVDFGGSEFGLRYYPGRGVFPQSLSTESTLTLTLVKDAIGRESWALEDVMRCMEEPTVQTLSDVRVHLNNNAITQEGVTDLLTLIASQPDVVPSRG